MNEMLSELLREVKCSLLTDARESQPPTYASVTACR
jgi:hypothetical protein